MASPQPPESGPSRYRGWAKRVCRASVAVHDETGKKKRGKVNKRKGKTKERKRGEGKDESPTSVCVSYL